MSPCSRLPRAHTTDASGKGPLHRPSITPPGLSREQSPASGETAQRRGSTSSIPSPTVIRPYSDSEFTLQVMRLCAYVCV